jgi:hypothetical protein
MKMREKSTFVDEEFKELAEKVIAKFPRFFPEDFDLSKFFFLRTEGIKPKWISKVRKIGHPWGSLPGLEDMVYLVETAAECWEPLNDAQRVLTVFHELKHVPEGGCDFDSNSCGKVEEHPVQDFPECIAAANGNLFWYEPGQGDDLPNILDSGSRFDLEEALKRTGFLEDESRKPISSPEDIGIDEEDEEVDADVAEAIVETMKKKKHEEEVEKIKRKAASEEDEEELEESPSSEVEVEEV